MKAHGTAVVIVAAVTAIYAFRLDPFAGLLLDDAWYMVLGKALAGGEGFRLISSSATAIVPSVPPGFPALLSIVFLVNPAYPGNLLWLKAVSLIAMAGVGVACWIDFTRHREVPASQALLLVAAILLTPAFVFLATSTVMPECVFTLAQLLTVIAVERAVRREPADAWTPMTAGAIAAVTMLIRTAGVAAVAASLAYFIVNRRWRQASIFAAVVAAGVLPWQLYSRAHAPTLEERMAHGGSIAYTYRQLLSMESPGAVSTTVTSGQMLVRSAQNVADLLTRDVGAVIVPVLLRGPDESGEELVSVGPPGRGSMGGAGATMVVSGLLALVMAAGIVRARAWFSLPALLIAASMAMIAPVGSQTFRYVLPLAPFLLLFLWRGIANPAAARIAILCVLGFHLMDHALYLRAKASGTPPWIADAREVDEVLNWMTTHLVEEGTVASSNPGLVYLRTGRRGVVSAFPDKNWETWRRAGVRYVATLRRTELPRGRYSRLLFQTNGTLWVVEM
jgi:hypothetical protein